MKNALYVLAQHAALAQSEESVPAAAKMSAGAASRMAMDSANRAYAPGLAPQGPDYTWFCYGFAAALILFSVYFLIRTFKSSDSQDKKTHFILALIAFTVASALAFIAPKLAKTVTHPTEFDMRTT